MTTPNPTGDALKADMDATALDSAIALCERNGMKDTATQLRAILARLQKRQKRDAFIARGIKGDTPLTDEVLRDLNKLP